MHPSAPRCILAILAVAAWVTSLAATQQLSESIVEPSHPAILYGGQTTDQIALLTRRLQRGEARLEYEERGGYLRSVLQALDVPVESQIAVFSGTSLQARLINSRNPRTIFFNDSVAVAWMSGGVIEMAGLDPRQGASFYLMSQTQSPGGPQILRDGRCLSCHYSRAALGIPGFLVRSIPSAIDGMILPWLGNYTTDHRSPIAERWGGWYVTGRGAGRHLGNAPIVDRTIRDVEVQPSNLSVDSLEGRFDTRAYLSPLSDIVALLVFDHQMRMMNLLVRLGWETRVGEYEKRLDPAALAAAANEVVDYLLFVDEAPLEPVQGSSGFATRFMARGPRDSKGRSLRDLDLERRLMRYPCSYLIYSEAFDALPAAARTAVYRRMWTVLSGADDSPRYARLRQTDRQAIVEILRETKRDLPAFFTPLQSRP